jgi:Na+/melibiose symporter-like transporter
MTNHAQKLTFVEKSGYSAADAAANFVFMTMILFQTNFYTDSFGLTASAAAAILLWPRLWDAFFDPIMGVLADRTNTRWGRFRPWILWTAIPWAVVMILAYTTPRGWSMGALIAYAAITNTMMMTLYSMNNMPYSALGGVMTGDLNERASLNSFRFIAVNVAQFVVGGFTLPLVAKFAVGHDRAHGWQMTMTIWAVLCLVLFMITFTTTKERIQPDPKQQVQPGIDALEARSKSNWRLATATMFLVTGFFLWASRRYAGVPYSLEFTLKGFLVWIFRVICVFTFLYALWKSLSFSVQRDFRDLAKNSPWRVMWIMTMVHFGILSLRGGANYNYYHHYADKAAMYDCVQSLGLTAPALAHGGIMETLGYIVHGDRSDLANSNVADVFNSIINMLGTTTTIIVIFLSAPLAKRYGKKAVAITGFALSTVNAFATYLLPPTAVGGMIALTIVGSVVYAPTIPLIWAIFADCADYSEWKTGRRFTGMVFATIGFALKAGLALGSASLLWILKDFFGYDTKFPSAPDAVAGYRTCVGIVVGIMFAICTVLLTFYKLNKKTTIRMADELAERRKTFAAV